MADSLSLSEGSTILVQHFHQSQPLAVTIVSSGASAAGGTARIIRGRAGPRGHRYDVALKVIPNLLDEKKQKVLEQLVRREVDAISQLSNRAARGVLPFIGTGYARYHMIIASKFMKYGNLLQYLEAIPTADRQSLVIEVAETVHWLHVSHNLVHGDLKCENVLVSDEGDALLADFGLATLVEQETSSVTTNTAIRQINTLPFAAPELLFGMETDFISSDKVSRPRSKTCQSDTYAFGMLVLQAFTGKRPWDWLSEHQIYGTHLTGNVHPRPLDDSTFRGLTDSWWSVCLECWKPRPRERPTMKWVWENLESKRRAPRVVIDDNRLFCVAFGPHKNQILAGCHNGTIRVLDAISGEDAAEPQEGHRHTVNLVIVSPDGQQICSAGSDGTVRRWDSDSGRPLGQPLAGHQCGVTCVAYSPDSTWIVSGSGDCTVRLWDSATGGPLGEPLQCHTQSIWSVAFSPDAGSIASGSRDETVRLSDRATGVILSIMRHGGPVWSVRFSSDRIHLVSAGYNTVKVWNVSTGRIEHTISKYLDWVKSIDISPSGKYIASGWKDGTVRIWNSRTGEPVGPPLNGHTGWVRSVAFSPDGRSIMSSSWDATVRVWDLFQ